ncbi:hypothetical protein SBF1_6380003 [Candidatus Desulfosporosinus infrequens]|uniref:Uncharacterized protein n=1 Tax=Candidatus Desulfosporosinus infrequens TaxID=2043169 RepID=A0A2U3LMT3_9FIRM|nr:hypothetical protein SBF1_6380003 [Candidatus Desulfosporosinus infrequens]
MQLDLPKTRREPLAEAKGSLATILRLGIRQIAGSTRYLRKEKRTPEDELRRPFPTRADPGKVNLMGNLPSTI